MPFDPSTHGLTPTAIERWLCDRLATEQVDSARGLYELMPLQRGGQLPFVDVPYSANSESHWADAARIADYVAHAPAGAQRVLDIGPGDGWPALPIAAARPDLAVIGVDASPLRAQVCTANARKLGLSNASFVTGDAAELPFADASFDLVTAASSLEEATTPDHALAECARVLRSGGVLRASSQDWRLGVPGFETVMLWEAAGTLLYSYVRRVQDPALERRYTLQLDSGEEASALHTNALLDAAAAPRWYGETALVPALGVELLERLKTHVTRSTVVELRRWSTPALVEALRRAGFQEARATVHAGELGRRFARDLLARDAMAPFAPLFADATRALGTLAGSQPGEAMVAAWR
jgi:ubiquinone/menaquinone biosynthesis C-methylase UbiE